MFIPQLEAKQKGWVVREHFQTRKTLKSIEKNTKKVIKNQKKFFLMF